METAHKQRFTGRSSMMYDRRNYEASKCAPPNDEMKRDFIHKLADGKN